MKGLGGAGAWEGSPGIWSLLRLVARFPWFELEFGDGMRGMGVEDGVYVTGCRWWARGHMECEELMRPGGSPRGGVPWLSIALSPLPLRPS
jgi:hypothetical protein